MRVDAADADPFAGEVMSSLLYKCLAKAIEGDGSRWAHGLKWVFARRAFLKVFDDHLECGDRRIENKAITSAVIRPVRSVLFLPGYVLKIVAGSGTYHFAVHGNPFWDGPLPFPVQHEEGAFSVPNLVFRILFIGYLVHLLSQWSGR
jgi:hypothetical protein